MSSFSSFVAGVEQELRKEASGNLGHAAELAGLYTLARPTIKKIQGKEVTPESEHKHELAGLGILAAPSAVGLAHSAWKRMRK